jgi:hypothetical protein
VAALVQSAAGCAGTLSGLEYVYVEGPLDSNPNKLAFAPCPPGKKATGGGAYISPQTTELAPTHAVTSSGAEATKRR